MTLVTTKPEAGRRPEPFEIAPIDCDVHIAVPSMQALVPYLDDYWQESVRTRGLDRHQMNVTGFAAMHRSPRGPTGGRNRGPPAPT